MGLSTLVNNGQLPITTPASLAANSSQPYKELDLWTLRMRNTSPSVTQTVEISVQRGAYGTARKLPRQVLLANESVQMSNIPMEPGDVLLGVTTTASTVDFDLTGVKGNPPPDAPEFSVTAWDATGAAKQVNGTAITGAITGASLAVTGGLTSSGPTGAGIGYATGAGGAVTQATNRSTGVTLSKLAGQITTNTASLAALATASFTVTNTAVAVGDVVAVSIQSGATNTNTTATVTTVAAGSFQISIFNGGGAAQSTAETGAIIINFAVIKSVAA